jgi:Holliday junction DNA helicase RuvA
VIGSLRGTLIDRDPQGMVLVEAAGVGYDLHVTGPTSAGLGDVGTSVFLRVYTRVREDAITLYGFASAEEKRCFEALIAAHGVGPSMAMALLTMHSPSELRTIVAMEDAAALAQVPGIGKKTAARLLMELKARFDVDLDTELVDIASTAGKTDGSAGTARADVAAALSGLGYSGDEIRRVIATLPSDVPTEELLRSALRELATT